MAGLTCEEVPLAVGKNMYKADVGGNILWVSFLSHLIYGTD